MLSALTPYYLPQAPLWSLVLHSFRSGGAVGRPFHLVHDSTPVTLNTQKAGFHKYPRDIQTIDNSLPPGACSASRFARDAGASPLQHLRPTPFKPKWNKNRQISELAVRAAERNLNEILGLLLELGTFLASDKLRRVPVNTKLWK